MYAERPPAAPLREHVARVWRRTVAAAEVGSSFDVLPDASLDIVWQGDGALMVAGPDTRPAPHTPATDADVVGVRFRPGVAPAMLGLPSSELRDTRVPLADVWSAADAAALAERLAGTSGWAAADVLERALAGRLPAAPPADPLVRELVRRLGRRGGRLARISEEVGVSERQLRRRCEAAVGYGPKTLDRVLRFMRFRELATAGRDLADLALDAGYTDQSHLTHECRRLAGRTPATLLAGR